MLNGVVRNHNTDGGLIGAYRHLEDVQVARPGTGRLLLTARTRHSGTPLAVAARIASDGASVDGSIREADRIGETLHCDCAAGRSVWVEKVAAFATALDPATSDPSRAACSALADAPEFAALQVENARNWGRLWRRAEIRADDPELERDLAFHIFHLLQTVSPNTVHHDAGFPSRGWQEAYHGQIFWDELFVFPFLNHRFPEIARSLLLYRYRRLPEARRAAQGAGFAGARFPWRSASTGEEETPSYQINPLSGRLSPDHTRLQRHIGAAVSRNVWQYYLATEDRTFLAEYGAEMLVEIARFWASIATHDPEDDRYDIHGVIGPDEYHNAYPGAAAPGLDNNAYTNVMAAIALRNACEALECLSGERRRELTDLLGIAGDEPSQWRNVASRLRLRFTAEGIIEQFEGFSGLKELDIAAFRREHKEGRIDHVLEASGDNVDAYQVAKQPDVLMLLYLLSPDDLIETVRAMGYEMDHAQIARTARYYLDRMSYESSLARVVCAGAFARIDPWLSWSFFEKSLRIDFAASNSASAQQGLHLGAMAGSLDVLQKHYLGVRAGGDALVLRPAPPSPLGPVKMRLAWRGCAVKLEWDGAVLRLLAARDNHMPLPVNHDGRLIALAPGMEVSIKPERT
jgi:trehalose/maltose hydrolase-like predicted phosphorylase